MRKYLRFVGVALLLSIYLFAGMLSTIFSLLIPMKVKDEDGMSRIERGLPVDFVVQDISRIASYVHEYPRWQGFMLPQEYPFVDVSLGAFAFNIIFWSLVVFSLVKLKRSNIYKL